MTDARADVLARATWRTRVVDLRLDEAALWHGVRKSYRSPIKRCDDRHDFLILRSNQTDSCRRIHAAAAGRATRPEASWRMMTDWVGAGHLLVIGAYLRSSVDRYRLPHIDGLVGFAAFERAGHWAYYGHSAILPEADVNGLNAALIWDAMRALKLAEVTRLELGWQGEATDDKGRSIEFFRRGFGGFDVPVQEGDAAWRT